MREVDRDAAEDGQILGNRDHIHAGVVGDLGEGTAHNLSERHRLGVWPYGLDSRDDQQALGVPAHAGGQVVEPEEGIQLLRVGLVHLELVDHLELAFEEALVAAGEAHVEVADALPQDAPLIAGDRHRGVLDLVEGAGELTDLVARIDRDRDDVGDRLLVLALERVDEVGQLPLGDVSGGAGEAPERPDGGPTDRDRDADGEQEDEHRAADVEPRLRARVGDLVRLDLVGLGPHGVGGLEPAVELGRGGRHPRGRSDLAQLAGESGVPLRLHLLGGGAESLGGRGEDLAQVVVGLSKEGGLVGVLGRACRDNVVRELSRQCAPRERPEEDGTLGAGRVRDLHQRRVVAKVRRRRRVVRAATEVLE